LDKVFVVVGEKGASLVDRLVMVSAAKKASPAQGVSPNARQYLDRWSLRL
jgi:hypothetical protein